MIPTQRGAVRKQVLVRVNTFLPDGPFRPSYRGLAEAVQTVTTIVTSRERSLAVADETRFLP